VANREEQIGLEVSGVWHGVYFSYFAVAIVRRGRARQCPQSYTPVTEFFGLSLNFCILVCFLFLAFCLARAKGWVGCHERQQNRDIFRPCSYSSIFRLLKSYFERFNSIRAVSKINERSTTGQYCRTTCHSRKILKMAITCAFRSERGEEKSTPDMVKQCVGTLRKEDIIHRSLIHDGNGDTRPETGTLPGSVARR